MSGAVKAGFASFYDFEQSCTECRSNQAERVKRKKISPLIEGHSFRPCSLTDLKALLLIELYVATLYLFKRENVH
jgi:hypothetical protein